MECPLELSDYRLHGEASAECKSSLAFESPIPQWHYALSLLCPRMKGPAVIEIEAEIACGAAGFGLNDSALSKYLTEEVFVRPDSGRTTFRIVADHPEPEMALVVRNVSDAGESARGVIHAVKIISDSIEKVSPPKSENDGEFVFAGYRFSRADILHNIFLGYDEKEGEILTRLRDPAAKGEPGFITDIFGIRTRTANLWPAMQPFDGSLWGVPIPGNWHWEAPEWIGLMRSVLDAKDSYRIIELGAGWGPAVASGGVFARLKGIKNIKLVAVEADPHHFGYLKQHLVDNNFLPKEYELLEAAVGDNDGSAEWPDTPEVRDQYGSRPIGKSGDYLGRTFRRTRKVKVLSFRSLLMKEPLWDMVHMDIQGSEVEVCQSALNEMNSRVARICVGTHSRKIDGDLLALLSSQEWVMENEKPSRLSFVPKAKTFEVMNTIDGIQIWRNPKFASEINAERVDIGDV
jgi:FkbM family methyltransferase